MKVDKNTKISKIIEAKPEAIEVIASVNKNFLKLKNPFLRKLLASRVSVEAAAKVGGTSTRVLLSALEKVGFDVDYEKDTDDFENNKQEINMEKTKIVDLDVRPILETGVDPFNVIMDTLKTMDDDETLKIINTFEPIPLLNILKGKGYEYETERPEEGVVHTYLHKVAGGKASETENEAQSTEAPAFEELEKKFEGKLTELDVRDLEMPMPMVSILEAIETLPEGHALFVHHKRLPQYLLPELKQREFDYVAKEVDADNMKLIIFRK